jgi:hypothetical protein
MKEKSPEKERPIDHQQHENTLKTLKLDWEALLDQMESVTAQIFTAWVILILLSIVDWHQLSTFHSCGSFGNYTAATKVAENQRDELQLESSRLRQALENKFPGILTQENQGVGNRIQANNHAVANAQPSANDQPGADIQPGANDQLNVNAGGQGNGTPNALHPPGQVPPEWVDAAVDGARVMGVRHHLKAL